MDIKETDILGANLSGHWYYRSKAKAMMTLLADSSHSTILDVGAGSGYFSRYLLSNSSAREAWCVDISYAAESDTKELDKPLHFRRAIGSLDADLVLLMDVLEHVDDDAGLLREYASKVPPGTRFLISVPAFQFLWSSHDVFLEHKRRYRLSQIEGVARDAGLNVKHGVYYFGAVFPIAATIRLAGNWTRKESSPPRSHLSRHHPLVNATLTALSWLELPLMRVNRLAGLTAFCLAEKACVACQQ
ncbi:MAG: class I SAM-dependent methyltransferase [Hydrogenophilaceae bacterium]|nr:class I SAM-dependent methyltransferase [Hydrogenophilaceae bacterium]